MKNYLLNHMFKSITNNEKGGMAALLSVLILSGIAVTTLTSAYVFLENRAKYNGRIIASYQTAYGMEDIAINLRQVYDTSIAVGATTLRSDGSVETTNGAACPMGTLATNYLGMILCIPNNSGDSMYQASNENAFGCPASPCFCVRTSSGVGENGRYCMSLANPATITAIIEENDQKIAKQRSKADKWFAKMERFFDVTIEREKPDVKSSMYAFLGYELKPPTVLGWLLPESVLAYEQTYEEDRGHVAPESYSNYQTAGGLIYPDGQTEAGYYPTPSRTQNTANTETPSKSTSEDPVVETNSLEQPSPTTPGDGRNGYQVITQACPTSSQVAAGTSVPQGCEACTGLRCSQIIVESAMCAGQREHCQEQGSSALGRMNIKFE